MEIKNLKKAAQRILKAIKTKEKIILYADSDLDGVTSLIILKETIKNLGGEQPFVYFPSREKEGYGLNKEALKYFKNFSPALLITLDCGISNFSEAVLAKKLGFDLIIIDHHEPLGRLPKADIIVDPKQKSDKYPFKGLATCGIVFKLSQVILKEKLSDILRKNFLELVALATLADMMPEIDENETMIEEGLLYLKETWRPGLKVFFEMEDLTQETNFKKIVQKIIVTLNIVEPIDHLNATYLILTTNSLQEAKNLALDLIAKKEERQLEIKNIVEEIEKILSQKQEEQIVFEGSYKWPISFLGSVASKIFHKYKKPTFIFKMGEKESRGAVRTSQEIDSVALMKKCQKYLLSYGGHPQASGFKIKNQNLDKFKSCLIDNYEKIK